MNNYLTLFGIILSAFLGYGQEEEDTIEVQEVTVIKSYTPSLQDVFKLRESPALIDSIGTTKKDITVEISSVPVASTFVPTKGTARKLQPKRSAPQFNSKATLGFGNFNQLLMEYNTHYAIDRRQSLDWLVYYNGLLKTLDEVPLDTRQGVMMLNLSHQYATSKRNAISQINFRQHQQSFYGLREPLTDSFILENINPKQNLNYLSVNSTWQWYEPVVKKLALNTYLTTDRLGTTEVEVDFSSKFQLVLGSIALSLLPEITYLTTQFSEDFYTREEVKYASGNGRVSFFTSKINGKFKFKAGASVVLGLGDEFEENSLFIYPILALSYLPAKGNFAPFLNVEGQLKQNSFRAFTHQNPYVAPGIALQAASIPMHIQLGTRSKFFAGWEFQWNLYYQQNDQHPLFRTLGRDIDRTNIIPYRYGNAFETTYASIASQGVEAQLSAAFKNGGRLKFSARYSDYRFNDDDQSSLLQDTTPFNLPKLSLLFNGTLKIGQKIYTQWYIKHLGARKNAYRLNFLGQNLENAPIEIEELPAFSQIDLEVHYQLNERWEIFMQGKNLSNERQYQWSNYPVYGTQVMLGMRYNFDLAF